MVECLGTAASSRSGSPAVQAQAAGYQYALTNKKDWQDIGQSISVLQKELDQVSAEKARVIDQKEQYKSQLDDTVKALVSSSTTGLKAELQHALEEKRKMAELTAELQEKLRKLASLDSDDVAQQNDSLRRELQRVTAERQAAWELLAGQEEFMTRMKDQEAEYERRAQRLNELEFGTVSDDARLQLKKEECENLIKSRMELQNMYDQALRDNDILSKRIVELQQELEHQTGEVRRLREIELAQLEHQAFQRQLEETREECRALGLENEELKACSRCAGSTGHELEQLVREKDSSVTGSSNLSQQRSAARQLAYMESIKALQLRLEQSTRDRDGALRRSIELQDLNDNLSNSAATLKIDLISKLAECEELAEHNQVLSSAAEKVPSVKLEMEHAILFFQRALRYCDSEHALASDNWPGLRLSLEEASSELDNARKIIDPDAERMTRCPLHPSNRSERISEDAVPAPSNASLGPSGWNDVTQRILEREMDQAATERRLVSQESAALQQQLLQRESELSGLAQQASELKRWNTVWRGELAQKIEEHEDLLLRSSDLREQLEQVVLERAEATEQAETVESMLRKEIHEQGVVIMAQRVCMVEEEAECKDAVRQHRSLLNEVEQAEYERSEVLSRSSELRSQLSEKIRECDILTNQNTDYRDVSKCLSALQVELEQIARDSQGIARQKDGIQHDLERAGLENLVLARESAAVSSQLQEKSQRIASLQEELRCTTQNLRSESETIARQNSAVREMSQHIRDLRGALQMTVHGGEGGMKLAEPPVPIRGVEFRELARNVSSLQVELLRIAEKGDEASGDDRSLQHELRMKSKEHEEAVKHNALLVKQLALKEDEAQGLFRRASEHNHSFSSNHASLAMKGHIDDEIEDHVRCRELCRVLQGQLDQKTEEAKRTMLQLTAVQGELVAELQDNEQLAQLVKVLRARLGEG